jgi:hypothetical protein
VKKNVTAAEDARLAIAPPMSCGLSKAAMSIMDIPQRKQPIIIGRRRPNLSKKKVGKRDPKKNMPSGKLETTSGQAVHLLLITPPSKSERFLDMPTFLSSTAVI